VLWSKRGIDPSQELSHGRRPANGIRKNNLVGSEDAMWFFALLLAQIPLPTTCDGVVRELKMNPPAYGDQGRAAYAWDKFLRACEARLGGPGKTFSAAEVNEIAKVINPPPR
jgi:hypothetical protein